MKQKTFDDFWSKDSENYKDLIKVIEQLKTEVEDEMLEHEDFAPNIQITISVNKDCTTWSYQSGDNSYTGSCYGDPFWGVGYVLKDSNAIELADETLDDLADQIEFEYENIACKTCGRSDLPLHVDYQCPNCHK